MIKSIFNGLGSGFGRAFGRILAYISIGFLLFYLLNIFDIDLSKYLKFLWR